MISAGDFRRGITYDDNGKIYEVIEYQHVKPARGAAFVRSKIKDIVSGTIKEQTFNPNDRYPLARIDSIEMQYLYNDGELYYFMDNETFDQMPFEYDLVEDAIKYIKENSNAIITFYKGKPLEVSAPSFVELEVEHTEPGIKGDTASGATKPATLETGAVVQVPLFVNIGDTVKVDTRSGDYLSRV